MRRSNRTFLFLFGIGFGLLARQLWINRQDMMQALAPPILEWIIRNKSSRDLITELDASGSRISQQLMDKAPSEHNYRVLNHLIGIERWGQDRLRVLGGAPFKAGEYDPYRPAIGLSWNELQDQFKDTRRETVSLIEQLVEEPDFSQTLSVLHNDFGELTLSGWAFYLRQHAEGEMWKMN